MTIPIRDLKNTTMVSKMCHESTEPIIITKNGYDDMVIMSSEVFEKYSKKIVNEVHVENSSEIYTPVKTDVYTVPKIKEVLKPIIAKYSVNLVIIFGPYAKGTAMADSHINLVVDCDKTNQDFYALLKEISMAFSVPVDFTSQSNLNEESELYKDIEENGIRLF